MDTNYELDLHDNSKLVIQDNALIFASYSLSLEGQRLIMAAIEKHHSNKSPYGGTSIETTITVNEYSELFNVEKGTAYNALKKASETLFKEKVTLNENGGKRDVYWLQEKATYDSGKITILFTEKVSKYIHEVITTRTAYRLAQASKLNSTIAIHLYALLQTVIDHETRLGELVIEIDELKEILQLESAYPRFVDFKRRVIKPALELIEKDTSISVKFDVTKRLKRRPVEITFFVTESEQLSLRLKTG